MTLLTNFLLFQAGWFAAVLGAANGYPWLGPAVLSGVVLLHVHRSAAPSREMLLVLAAALAGVVFDSSLVALQLVAYPSGQWLPWLAPYWIVGMWMLFATTLNVSLRWLHSRFALAAACGVICGPLSYLAGQELGGIELLVPELALASLAIGWGIAMPLLVRLAMRLDGYMHLASPNGVQR